MPEYKREDFGGPEAGYLICTWAGDHWRYRPVIGHAVLTQEEAAALGLFMAAETPMAGVPLIRTVRPPMADLEKAWYEATRVFGPYNGHPQFCEDWNLEAGGDSDLGETLVAPFDGVVITAKEFGGGWGKIVRILGLLPDGNLVTWMGAHLDRVGVAVGEVVRVGEVIGTIGTANGKYAAHLHEQISVGAVPDEEAFGTDRRYKFVQPSKWYREHGVPKELVDRVTLKDGR